MSRALTPGELKALVRQLVTAVGGVEAAAVILDVTHQWVSDLQNVNKPAQMTFLQVCALEAVAGRDVVTGAASRAIRGPEVDAIGSVAVQTVSGAADLMARVHAMDADGKRDAGEIRDVQAAAQVHLRRAAEVVAAASRLQPGESQ